MHYTVSLIVASVVQEIALRRKLARTVVALPSFCLFRINGCPTSAWTPIPHQGVPERRHRHRSDQRPPRPSILRRLTRTRLWSLRDWKNTYPWCLTSSVISANGHRCQWICSLYCDKNGKRHLPIVPSSRKTTKRLKIEYLWYVTHLTLSKIVSFKW